MGVEVAKIVEAACAGKFPTESSLLGFREPPTPGTHYLRNGSWVPPLTDDEGTGEQPRSDKQVGAQGPARNSTE
jgi:hypothetical protein